MSKSLLGPRSLTLTEELEKLEQQITLTLQEMDSNFSKAHRIVTTRIIPTVEEYARHSSEVWEGSKFWKHFFEASANVSLSGYEENDQDEATQTDATPSLHTPPARDDPDSTVTGGAQRPSDDESFGVESPTQLTRVHSTPRLTPSSSKKTNRASPSQRGRPASPHRSPSPRKYTGHNPLLAAPSSEEPSTPPMRATANLDSSPFQPESAIQPSAFPTRENNDPLMHRVLDKNYRVQATPMTQRRQKPAPAAKTPSATATHQQTPWDDSPQSSPEISAPQLRSELFSPAKGAPRTPGLSVLTPANRKTGPLPPTTSTGKQLFSAQDKAYTATRDRTRASHIFDDSDEDGDGLAALSPPKTMQFHLPHSRLLQTPAREASRKIVDDLLLTAGADATDDIEHDDYEFEIPSPSVIKQALEDDTF